MPLVVPNKPAAWVNLGGPGGEVSTTSPYLASRSKLRTMAAPGSKQGRGPERIRIEWIKMDQMMVEYGGMFTTWGCHGCHDSSTNCCFVFAGSSKDTCEMTVPTATSRVTKMLTSNAWTAAAIGQIWPDHARPRYQYSIIF